MQENSYSMVAAKWWVEKILEILPAEAFWGKFDATEVLNNIEVVNRVSGENKEICIRGLAKRIENYMRFASRLTIAYPGGILNPGAYPSKDEGYVSMRVTETEVKVWSEDGKCKTIYKKEE